MNDCIFATNTSVENQQIQATVTYQKFTVKYNESFSSSCYVDQDFCG